MSAIGDPYATFRPRRGRRVAWVVAAMSVTLFGALALVVPSTGSAGWSVADSLLLWGFGWLVAVAMWRFARLEAVPSERGIVVRNVLLTRDLTWSEIGGVRFGSGDAWAWLDLKDGDEVAVMAIQRSDGDDARRAASRLMALVQVNA
ncbi:PH domain-containing protein [Angustibacter luteus]|uniref:PH domain-containing protein n=1 Tax=Angustibacter luteus TaxID=658456 RepID=A0ABW1JAF3_9ACTN